MVALFTNCEAAARLLASHGDLKRKWNWSVEWLGDELERVGTKLVNVFLKGQYRHDQQGMESEC